MDKGCTGGSVLRGIAKRQESAMGGKRQNGVVKRYTGKWVEKHCEAARITDGWHEAKRGSQRVQRGKCVKRHCEAARISDGWHEAKWGSQRVHRKGGERYRGVLRSNGGWQEAKRGGHRTTGAQGEGW